MKPTPYHFGGMLAACALCLQTGCGTTRWSDTQRTATEQLLVSDAVDRSISEIDFASISGRDVYLDARFINAQVDVNYITSTLRQHMLASGCVIKDKPEDAEWVVEVRTGAVGTNRADLLFGLPATNLPTAAAGLPATSIPEIPFVKRTAQQGVCKLALFCYDRSTGQPVWQSGVRQVASNAKDVWVFGAGPFQRGTIYDGTKFAGERFNVPLADGKRHGQPDRVWVTHEIKFADPKMFAKEPRDGKTAAAATDKPADAAKTASLPPLPPAATPVMPSPPPVPAPPSSSVPNAAAGAVGALQAFDWANTQFIKK